jgi:N-ethylmaleimide reductase
MSILMMIIIINMLIFMRALFVLIKKETPLPTLFDPIQYGSISAVNRIVMAPLTRGRATRDHVPTKLMVEYYRQRASAGLIISEAIGISQEGLGWPHAPGLWNKAQTEAWKPVTEAVHKAGGKIVAQLWHMGRKSHPSMLGGADLVSSSASTAPGQAHTYDGKKDFTEARPLKLSEISRLVNDYCVAGRNAISAGFDGVQFHAAKDYLIAQFLRDDLNFRSDAYGGSVENRIRLLGEITQALCDEIGKDRVNVRLAPIGDDGVGGNDSDPHTLFPVAAAMLSAIGIAFLDLREPLGKSSFPNEAPGVAPAIRKAFKGLLVLNSDFTGNSAEQALADGMADAISFGRPFIANPDLPFRLREGLPLADFDPATLYSQGPEGYSDYLPAPAAGSRSIPHRPLQSALHQ